MAYKLRYDPRKALAEEDKVLKDGKVLRYDLEPEKENKVLKDGKVLRYDLEPEKENKVRQTASTPNTAPQFKDESVAIPKLYEEDGKLNRRYNTNIFEDMLAGVNLGGRVGGANGNSLQQVAGQLGGLIGGIFSKNIAGRQRFERDLQTAEAINQAVNSKTNAQLRIEAEARQKQALQLQIQKNAQTQARLDTVAKSKGTKQERETIMQNLGWLYGEGQTNEFKAMQSRLAELDGLNASELPEDYGLNMDAAKPIGNFMYSTVKGTNKATAVRDEEGKVVSNLTMPQFISMAKTLGKSKLNDTDLQDVFKQAVEITDKREKDGFISFNTGKDNKRNNIARTAHITQLANQLMKNKENNAFETVFTVNDETFSLSDYLPKPISSTTGTEVPKTPESPFMPSDTGTDQPIFDATGTIQVPVGGKPMVIPEKQTNQPKYTFNIEGKDVDVEFTEADKGDKNKQFYYVRDDSGINVNEGKWKKLGSDAWITKRNGIVYTVIRK